MRTGHVTHVMNLDAAKMTNYKIYLYYRWIISTKRFAQFCKSREVFNNDSLCVMKYFFSHDGAIISHPTFQGKFFNFQPDIISQKLSRYIFTVFISKRFDFQKHSFKTSTENKQILEKMSPLLTVRCGMDLVSNSISQFIKNKKVGGFLKATCFRASIWAS